MTDYNEVPKTYQILTNLTCNLDCAYCYEHQKDGKVNKIEFIKDFLKAKFEEDKEVKATAVIEVIGGEPLLHPELLDETFAYALDLAKQYNRPIMFAISTNGTRFEDEKVRKLLLKYRDFIDIGISIDGLKEIHDKYRVYANTGKGSYDDIVRSLDWVFKNLKFVGVKATFTLETIEYYDKAVINLINLGFKFIAANIVYEDFVPYLMAQKLALKMMNIVDYLEKNNLLGKVFVYQITGKSNDEPFNPLIAFRNKQKEKRNYCGSVIHMTCLGFDGKVYGCNRFCTMKKEGMEIGELQQARIKRYETILPELIKKQPNLWPGECEECPFISFCPTCSAAPFEYYDGLKEETLKKYLAEKRMCGWTFATMLAKLYYFMKLQRISANK
ncbi:radical SAM protein [Deferribacter abyssi]|uniref:radical SAM protein n=1 Tax=Deferribacter abyssi TaxID=213806 RepID=UPI003C22560A